MKKTLLAGIAVLFLATGTAHAAYDECAVVLKTPDGFLALREKPSARSKLLHKLHRGKILTINKSDWQKKINRWADVSVQGIASDEFPDGDLEWESGFVSRKYIQQFRCSEAESGNPYLPVQKQVPVQTYPIPGAIPVQEPEHLPGTVPGG
jgi:hypothetical protein